MCQVTLTGIYDQKVWRTSLQLENVTIDIKYGLKAKVSNSTYKKSKWK